MKITLLNELSIMLFKSFKQINKRNSDVIEIIKKNVFHSIYQAQDYRNIKFYRF